MDTETMIVINEQGEEELYEIVLTIEGKQFNKNYVIFKLPGDENEEVFAYSYDADGEAEGGDLKPIETDEEWDFIEEVLGAFTEEDEE